MARAPSSELPLHRSLQGISCRDPAVWGVRILLAMHLAEKRMISISRKSSQSMEVWDGAGSVPPEGQEVSAHGPC